MTSIRLLAIIEASSLTGPAKNLIDFCVRAREIDAPRIEPFLVTYRRGDEAPSDGFLDAARAAGLPVEIVRERGRFDRNTLAALRQIVAKVDPAILQTHAIKSHFLMKASGLWKERPWIAFHHGYTLTDARMLAYNMLDLWSLRTPARIVTVSEAFRRQLTRRGISRNRIRVLHNAVDPDWVERNGLSRASAREFLGLQADERMVLAAGRLSREKAFAHLIAAIRAMNERPRLFIAGEGPERADLEGRISAWGLTEFVQLKGSVAQLPYFAAADVLAISSIKEGSPNVLLEAMAAGLPVVATRVGGIPEIVTDGDTAMLVPPRDPAALARALARLLSQPDEARRMAERAHSAITERFDPRMRAQALAELYAAVAAGD